MMMNAKKKNVTKMNQNERSVKTRIGVKTNKAQQRKNKRNQNKPKITQCESALIALEQEDKTPFDFT